jgi:transposase
MKSPTIAVDVAKSIFEVAVSRQPGRVAENHRLSRDRMMPFFAQREAATVVFEACGTAHYWGRQLQSLGHRVVLLPPHSVRPYVTRNKTDRTDAKGILEAFRNQEIHPVPVKSPAQQQLTALHRLRSAWLATRTARINTVRALLREFGVVIPRGAHHVVPRAWAALGDADSGLPDVLRSALAEVLLEIREIEDHVHRVETALHTLALQVPLAARLRTIPGIGPLSSTALVGFVGDIGRFHSARHFASYLGLTPRERSSGTARHLGAISKRGNTYLRMLLVHGARSVLCRARRSPPHGRLRTWAAALEARRGHNKATVALANKLARLAYAVCKHDTNFKEDPIATTPAT